MEKNPQPEPSIEGLWKICQDRFAEKTNKVLNFSPPKTLKELRDKIQSQQADYSTKDKDVKEKVEDASLNALYFLKLLGGVAAEGAGMVFGPADLCFNAISLLIDIPSKVHEFHEAVDGLFEEVSVALSTFEIYSRIEKFSSIDPSLKRIIHRIMISFVDVCALSIVLRESGKWKKFKVATKKVLFDDDSGVKDAIDGFRRLVDTQRTIEGPISLEQVLESRQDIRQMLTIACDTQRSIADILNGMENVSKGVDAIVKDVGNRKLEDIAKINQKKIVEALLLSDDDIQASKSVFIEHWKKKFPGTGSWLHEKPVPEYEKWANRDSHTNPLLFLTGGSSTGKSFLTSVIIHELQSNYSHKAEGSREALVAYHFFPRVSDKGPKDQQPTTTALKCLAIQIAAQDAAYSKSISAWCGVAEKDPRFKGGDSKWFWDQLKFTDSTRNITYFLILDGLDQCDDRDQLLIILRTLQHSLSDSDRPRIRLLATGKVETFAEDAFGEVPKIHVPEYNSPEIKYSVDAKLKEFDLFQDQDPEMMKWRSTIHDKLQELAGGDFFKVDNVLDQINVVVGSGGSDEDLQKILNKAGQDRRQIAQSAIDAANEDLGANEIEELNELLKWVVFGNSSYDVNVSKLQALLYLRFNQKTIQSLSKKLEGKYSKFFDVDEDGHVSMKEDIDEMVKTDTSRRKNDETPRITATITITNAEFKTAHSFLWKLCETAMTDFTFNDLATHTKIKDRIGVNAFDAHLSIVKQSFKLLLNDPNDMTKSAAGYMLGYLPEHLSFLREAPAYGELSNDEKREIGTGVFSLIVKGDILKAYWDCCGPPEHFWVEHEDDVNALWEWLKDTEAIRHLGTKDNDWLKDLKLKVNPNRSLMLPVTEMIVKAWLQDRKWKAEDAFRWIRGFLSLSKQKLETESNSIKEGDEKKQKLENPDEAVAAAEEDDDDLTETYEDALAIAKAGKWAQKLLEVQNLGSLWYERLGETYLALFEQKPAMDAFTEAIKLDHQNWRCFEGLANAFAEKDNLPSAISEMEKALELLREIKERDESEGNSFLGDLLLMADWHTELHQLERAIKYYQEATHVDPYKYEAHYKLFKTLVATSKEEDAQALLRDLHVNKSKDSPLSQLCAMFQPLISDYWACDLVFGMMFSTTQQTPLFNTILEDIDTAIELARNEKRISDLAALLLHKGIAVYYYDQSQTKAAESALELWEECGELISNIDLTFTAFRFISAHHFHQAIIPGRDPQIHLEKMQLIVKRRVSDFPDPHGKAYLGAYYVLSKDLTKAKKLLLEDFNSAMALLSDDVDYNDYQGYYSLAEILMRSGDDLNTLSAWSLLGPSDLDTPKDVLQFDDQKTQDIALELLSVVQSKVSPEASNREIFEALRKECQLQQQNRNSENPDDASRLGTLMEIEYHLAVNTPTYSDSGRRNGYLTNYCDGRVCGKRWDYADDFYCCKICPDVQFCEECRDNLKNGKLKRFICNKNHDWLHVPKWDDEEYMKIGKGNVRIGGEMKDGARVGGQGVPISEWLNLLRDEWGIPRIEKPNKKDETQAENTNLPGGQEDTEPQVQEEISKEADD